LKTNLFKKQYKICILSKVENWSFKISISEKHKKHKSAYFKSTFFFKKKKKKKQKKKKK